MNVLLKNSYRILDLKPGASKTEIKEAYKDFSKLYHPDFHQNRGSGVSKKALEKMKELNEAYNRLITDYENSSNEPEYEDIKSDPKPKSEPESFIFPCPSCGAKNRIKKNALYENARCGKCGKLLFSKNEQYEEKKQNTKIIKLDKRVFLELEHIPSGVFMMGDKHGNNSNAKPYHKVKIKGFWMGKYTVTISQWKAVTGDAPSARSLFTFGKSCNYYPADCVNFNLCQIFCEKLSKKTGLIFRLPSEAEWEYACRAGTNTKYYNGNNEDDLEKAGWLGINRGLSHRIGQKTPNQWGLYDMHGNISEFCEDTWHNDYIGAPIDGSAWTSGDKNFRVVRGGNRFDNANNCTSYARKYKNVEETYPCHCLRVVMS